MATTLGVIIGSRRFFPAALSRDGREEILRTLEQQGYKTVCLTPEQSNYGVVESLQDARKCADLFKQHRDQIDGILVSLPNFGDERSVANSIRMSGLEVPVLIQAYPDEPGKMVGGLRRDSFCGKISVCNNLRQYGIRFTLSSLHTEAPSNPAFAGDLKAFGATCRIVKGLKNLRVGLIGARPAAFNTVRFSEKLMENHGISVETLDLSEVLGRIQRLKDDEENVKAKVAAIQDYVSTQGVPETPLLKMAKFGVVVDEWLKSNELAGSSVQCWTALQQFFGVYPCTLMSMMSNNLMPSACETDMIGMISMYILQLAAGEPSAIVDWNNNYGEDPDKAVIFHCSNLPKHFFEDFKMDYMKATADTYGKENAFGIVVGQLKSGPFTYCRVSTDDLTGALRAYVGEGEITGDRPESYGGYGVVRIPGLQTLLKYICNNSFEHHVAVNRSQFARAVADALGNYKRWDVYHHQAA